MKSPLFISKPHFIFRPDRKSGRKFREIFHIVDRWAFVFLRRFAQVDSPVFHRETKAYEKASTSPEYKTEKKN